MELVKKIRDYAFVHFHLQEDAHKTINVSLSPSLGLGLGLGLGLELGLDSLGFHKALLMIVLMDDSSVSEPFLPGSGSSMNSSIISTSLLHHQAEFGSQLMVSIHLFLGRDGALYGFMQGQSSCVK